MSFFRKSVYLLDLSYHYYFGVEIKKTGEVRLIDCTDEQWDDIVKEYGPVGRGPPVDQIAGSDDRTDRK